MNRPRRSSMLPRLAVLLAPLLPGPALAAVLPEAPSPALRLTVSVTCDFEERWWEVAVHPGTDLPLEIHLRRPGTPVSSDRRFTRSVEPLVRDEIYGLARRAFDEFRIDRRPTFTGPGADRSWTGERTIALAAMVLDDELGRVDRIDLAIDLMRGRSIPPAALALVDLLAEQVRPVDLDLDCP